MGKLLVNKRRKSSWLWIQFIELWWDLRNIDQMLISSMSGWLMIAWGRLKWECHRSVLPWAGREVRPLPLPLPAWPKAIWGRQRRGSRAQCWPWPWRKPSSYPASALVEGVLPRSGQTAASGHYSAVPHPTWCDCLTTDKHVSIRTSMKPVQAFYSSKDELAMYPAPCENINILENELTKKFGTSVFQNILNTILKLFEGLNRVHPFLSEFIWWHS